MNPWESAETPKIVNWPAISMRLEVILRRVLQALAIVVCFVWFRALWTMEDLFDRITKANQITIIDSTLAPFYVLVNFAQPIALTCVWFLMLWLFKLQYDPYSTHGHVSVARQSMEHIGRSPEGM